MIPDFYRRWLRPIEFEERWEKRRCETCEQASAEIPKEERFSIETKCCTYFPFLPNFTLGKLLEDSKENASLRLRFSQALTQGRGTPLGLFPAPEYEARRESLGKTAFGRATELLCSFFDRAQGLCSIWKERPGVCASFICQSTYGNRGQELKKCLEEYLNLFEWTLAHETLWRMGYTQDDLRFMESVRKDPVWRPERAWGEYWGREEEFLLRAYQTAREVPPAEIEESMGEEGARIKVRIRQFLTTQNPNYDRVPRHDSRNEFERH